MPGELLDWETHSDGAVVALVGGTGAVIRIHRSLDDRTLVAGLWMVVAGGLSADDPGALDYLKESCQAFVDRNLKNLATISHNKG